jgi:hypothetical protein
VPGQVQRASHASVMPGLRRSMEPPGPARMTGAESLRSSFKREHCYRDVSATTTEVIARESN